MFACVCVCAVVTVDCVFACVCVCVCVCAIVTVDCVFKSSARYEL